MAKITREEIIQRAIRLFLVGGYDDTSMAQLAAACGIRKASLYHHFPSKDALTQAAIEQTHAYFREHIFAIAWRDDTDAAQRLRALGEAVYAFFTGRDGGCLAGNFVLTLTDRAPHFQTPLRAYFDDWAAAMGHLLTPRHGMAHACALAFDALARIQGGIMMMRLYQDARHLRRAIDSSIGML